MEGTTTLYTVRASKWRNSRNQQLQVYEYDVPEPSAVVFLHHGYSEYVHGAYKRLLVLIAEANMSVVTFDMHGHGRSEPLEEGGRTCVERTEHLFEDAAGILRDYALSKTGPTRRLYGVAHSVGGMVLATLEARTPGTFSGLALNCPGLGVSMNLVEQAFKVVMEFIQWLGFSPSRYRIIPGRPWTELSDEDDVIQRVMLDALWENGDLRMCTAVSLMQGMHAVKLLAPRVACPLYIQWAEKDLLTCVRSARFFAETSASSDVTWHYVKGGAMHTMLHGARGPQLMRDIRDWLLKVQAAQACA